jgi:hypothetical protein
MALWHTGIFGGIMADNLPVFAPTNGPGPGGLSWEAEKIAVSAKLDQPDVKVDFVFRHDCNCPVAITSIDTSCSGNIPAPATGPGRIANRALAKVMHPMH